MHLTDAEMKIANEAARRAITQHRAEVLADAVIARLTERNECNDPAIKKAIVELSGKLFTRID